LSPPVTLIEHNICCRHRWNRVGRVSGVWRAKVVAGEP